MKLTRNTWLLIALVFFAIVYFGNQGAVPKEAVADAVGKTCSVSSDCTCLGKMNLTGATGTNWGIGVGNCVDCSVAGNQGLDGCNGFTSGKHCDMGYCVDMVGVADWARANPVKFLKEHPIYIFALLGAAVLYFMLPKN